jgi:predicted GNAT superfamily acetyltransferase
MRLRTLSTLDECRQVTALEKAVWEYTDPEEVLPPAVMHVSIRRGGILIGGFDDAERLQGFVYSTPGLKAGVPMQWSHALAVAPRARGAGLGRDLKLAQRVATIGMGLDLIEWTFDPLEALNAYFNLAGLGVVVEEYEEDVYGASSSALHHGAPTDRFVAAWRSTTPHVERRIASRGQPMVRDSRVMAAPIVNPSGQRDGRLAPGKADLTQDAPRVLVEIPAGFRALLRSEAGLALEWRLATRRIFQAYFGSGYRVVDFLLTRGADRGYYLLARHS